MKIPSPSLHMQLPFGQKAQQAHPQLGQVELVSDGRIDDVFKKLPGQQDSSLWHDLGEDRFVSFLERAGSIVTDTMKPARELFANGGYADGPTKLRVSDESTNRFKAALAGSQIPGHAYVTVGTRGAVTHVFVDLLDHQHSSRSMQSLLIDQNAEGAWAELRSKREAGVHKLRVPFHEDGSLNLSQASESLELFATWPSKSATMEGTPTK